MSEEEIKYIDAESYQGIKDKELSFRMIVLEHLRRLARLGSQEFHGGLWLDRIKAIGSYQVKEQVYESDTREEYSNAVDFLFDILYPHFDEQIKKDVLEFEKWEIDQETKIKEKYVETNSKTLEKKWLDKEAYKTELIKITKRKLFRILNQFLFRTRYLEGMTFEEELSS